MRPAIACAAIAALLVAVQAAAAEKVRKGVSKKAAAQLDAIAKRNAAQTHAARLKRHQGVREAIQRDLEDQLAAAHKALEAQPQYAEYKEKLDAILKAPPKVQRQRPGKLSRRPIQRPQLSKKEVAERTRALRRLNAQYKEMFLAAYKIAGIDTKRVSRLVRRHLGGLGDLKTSGGQVATFVGLFAPDEDPPPPAPTAQCLEPPYESQDTTQQSHGVVLSNRADTDPEAGTTDTYGYAHLGGHGSNSAVVGNYVTVPAGYTKLRVQVKIEAYHALFALSIAGVSYSGADLMVELSGLDGGTERAYEPLGLVVAPVFFISHNADEEGEYLFSHTFTIPDTGGEYLVRAGSSSYFFGLVNGGATATVDTAVEEICVEVRN